MRTGVLFASLYVATGARWLPIVVHTAFDVTAPVDLRLTEAVVAGYFFA